MSLDLSLLRMQETPVYTANITHNLTQMAEAVGLYGVLWRPEENGITTAEQLIDPLKAGIAALRAEPVRFRALSAPNGWGTYDHFLPFLQRLLLACQEYPDARVEASR